MNLNIYKSFFFILFFIVNYIHCIDLNAIERPFLSNLVQKINDTNLNVANIESKICDSISGCQCDSNGYLTWLEITSNSFSLTSYINWNDFNGFSRFSSLTIKRINIDDQNFIYNPNVNISFLTISTLSTLVFDQHFPKYQYLEINLLSNPFDIFNLKPSFFTNLETFSTINIINLEYDGEGVLNDNNLQYLTMKSSNLPNLTFLPNLRSLEFSTPYNNFSQSSFSNLLTFNKVFYITLKFEGTDSYDFPIEFSKIENPQWISLSVFHGSNFNINGSIPISKLPESVNHIGIMFGYYPKVPDMKLFQSCYAISLQYSGISGDLPSVNNTLQQNKLTHYVFLNDNQITGTIDESWCFMGLDISNNWLSGPLPDCKYCYQNDPLSQSFYLGNNFTNYNSNVTCSYEQISVNKIVIDHIGAIFDSYVVLMGKNIGFNLNNILTYPEIKFNQNNLNDSFSGYFVNGYNSSYDIIQVRFLVPGINFTISLNNTPPIINSISVENETFTILGEYFSYDKSVISIDINNGKEILKCIVRSCTFYEIKCKINIPVFEYGLSSVNLSINSHNIVLGLTLTNITIANGYCDEFTKSCYCYSKWISLYLNGPCLIPNHYLSSSSTVQSSIGGKITLSGWFGDVHNNLKVLLNNKAVQLESFDNETIVLTISAGVGSIDITIIQNNITWSGLIYPYTDSIIKCLNDCSGNGICNSNGECNCNDNYFGLDCSSKDTGSSTVIINPNGSTTISNQDIVYLIYLESIVEIDLKNNQVPNSSIDLKNGWKIDHNSSSSLVSNFYQKINNVIIIMTIENVQSNNGKEFTFAGNQFTVSKDGFKLSLSVSDWNYKSNLNTLQIQMSSDVSLTEGDKINKYIDSGSDSTNVEISSNSNNLENVNYLKISKSGKTLYGRFQDKMLSDGRSTTTITKIISKDDKKVVISLDMPHCNQCLLDPDFSVIINSDFKSSDSCGKGNKKPWLIPVAVTVPVVGCALIIAAFLLRNKIMYFRREKNR
ncbi:hypothetical protein ACTFIU_009976 [Dictyostelium citrinum]